MVEGDGHGSETLGAVTQAFPELTVFALKGLLKTRRTDFDQIRLVVALAGSRHSRRRRRRVGLGRRGPVFDARGGDCNKDKRLGIRDQANLRYYR